MAWHSDWTFLADLYVMFQNHLLLLYRTFKRYKTSFFINLIGLSAGLTAAIFIYLWVHDEISIDKFHTKDKQLYQVMSNEITDQGIRTTDANPAVLSEGLKTEMPEVVDALTVSPTFWLAQSKVSLNNAPGIKAGGRFAGPNFFKVLSYDLVKGNMNTALRGSKSIVISESLARKLFHRTDVLGKLLIWRNADMQTETPSTVTGVFADVPANASERFDFLVSLDVLFDAANQYKRWTNNGPNTILILKQGTNLGKFNLKIKNYLQTKGVQFRQLFIRPFSEGYLYNNYEQGKQAGGRIEYVRLFSLLAVFILVIACVNFMNLSTAKASRRMKEVGVKKVLGAQRGTLIVQYLGESLILTILALFISLVFVELLLPQFNAITGKDLSLIFDMKLIVILCGICIFTGLLSGSYPALYLSGFHPSTALKGKMMNSSGTVWTRQGLVVFQFSLSIILIVSVFVIYKQIQFLQEKSLGYSKENVIYFEAEGKIKTNIEAFIQAIRQIPGVKRASSMDRSFLGEYGGTDGNFNWENRNPNQHIRFQHAGINNDLIETLGMKMIAGRSFLAKYGNDSSKMLLNETAIKVMGLKNPVGKVFNLWGKDFEIVGIVKDFNFESLQEQVKPLFFEYESKNTNRVLIRLARGQEKQTIDALKDFYQRFNPGYQLQYTFLDQDFQQQFVSENRVAALSKYFAGLAIVISSLGLFGLAAFTAERKIKEIGIRKVLGASEWSIIYMLTEEFLIPVVASIAIALPLSYILCKYWLQNFAYRIELHLWYFLGAGLLALLISWLTVGMQALKSASIDPIQCLRAE
jgi:putative ABC transport system permease protein